MSVISVRHPRASGIFLSWGDWKAEPPRPYIADEGTWVFCFTCAAQGFVLERDADGDYVASECPTCLGLRECLR